MPLRCCPQGPLVVSGDKLLIPGGRSVPACYDRHTGELLYYQLADNGKKGGGAIVAANDKLLFNGGAIFDLATEKYLGPCGEHTVFDQGRLYDFFDRELRISDLKSAEIKTTETLDRKGAKTKSTKWSMPLADCDAQRTTCLIKAVRRSLSVLKKQFPLMPRQAKARLRSSLSINCRSRVRRMQSSLPTSGCMSRRWMASFTVTDLR